MCHVYLFTYNYIDAECSVIYMLQPPPELPCNPFITHSQYGNLVLQCYVAVSQQFVEHTRVEVSIVWYHNVTVSGDQHRSTLGKIWLGEDNFVVHQASQSVEGFLAEHTEYWCQVLLNGEDAYDSVNLRHSSVTNIRESSHYRHLPFCSEDIPLGLPVAECALDDVTFASVLTERVGVSNNTSNCLDAVSEEISQEEGEDRQLGPLVSTCNETTQHDDKVVNVIMVIIPFVILGVLVLTAAVALVIILIVIRRRKICHSSNANDRDIMMRYYNTKTITADRQASLVQQVRRASSLPNLCDGGAGGHKPLRNHLSADSGITEGPIDTTSNDHLRARKLLGRIRNYYEGSAVLSRGATIGGGSTYTNANSSAVSTRTLNRLSSRASDTCDYVDANPVKFPVRRTETATPPFTREGVYLTLVDANHQPPAPPAAHIATGTSLSSPCFLHNPIYEEL